MNNFSRTNILDLVSRKMTPFMILYGLYLIANGHLSPGGGFQGGVALASGGVLLLLRHGEQGWSGIVTTKTLNIVEAAGFGILLLFTAVTLILGRGILAPFNREQATGPIVIFILNLLIGLKVGAGVSLIVYMLFTKKESE